MARQRSSDRDKAFEIYKASKGDKPIIDIAAGLNLKPSQIRKWKSQDKWDEQMNRNVTEYINGLIKLDLNLFVSLCVKIFCIITIFLIKGNKYLDNLN